MAGRQELRGALVRAVELAQAGDRAGAHELVDHVEDDPTACWIHAVLHKLQPDEANARYWYRRSGQFYESYADPRAELAAIRASPTYRADRRHPAPGTRHPTPGARATPRCGTD